jgi:hemoglobin/transferrin/lactoferrin receptor protein
MTIKNNGKATAISEASQPARLPRARLAPGIALSGLLALAAGLPVTSWAAESPSAANHTFSVPAGPLSGGLQALANDANVMLVFTPDQAANKTTSGLKGNYSVQSAFDHLLAGSGLKAVREGNSYRLVSTRVAAGEATPISVPELSVVSGLDDSVVAGRSTLKKENIERIQADNVAELLDKLPGVSSAGSPRPGGQSLNIWGMGGMEDINVTLDGAPKGFEKYRQGSVFIEPELIKQIDVDKGPFNLANGNGGFGGSIKIVTKDAADLLQPGENFGGMLKYGFHTNDNQNIYSGALYGKTPEGFADGMIYASKRDGGNITRPDGTHFDYSANRQGT